MTLDLTLKAAAIGLLGLSGYQFLYLASVPLAPVVAANLIFVMSIFSRSQPQRIALISLAFALLIPIGAFKSYADGDSTLMIAVSTLLIFSGVAYVAYRTIRNLYSRQDHGEDSGIDNP